MTKNTPIIIDGKALAEHWLGEIAVQTQALGAPLHLVAVCASDDPGLKAFVELKKKAAEKSGFEFSAYYPESEQRARETLSWLAEDETVHGIFVELPLPDDFDRTALLSLIPLEKDVDLISPAGEKSFHNGSASVLPPAVGALARVFSAQGIEPDDLQAVVVGQGDLVGKPVTHWLREQGSDVSVIDIDTKNPEHIAVEADLVIAGVGVPDLITASWVKEGATVIDYGFSKKGEDFVGDVAVSARKKAGAITPVPGGMGPLVVAATLENLLTLATK